MCDVMQLMGSRTPGSVIGWSVLVLLACDWLLVSRGHQTMPPLPLLHLSRASTQAAQSGLAWPATYYSLSLTNFYPCTLQSSNCWLIAGGSPV